VARVRCPECAGDDWATAEICLSCLRASGGRPITMKIHSCKEVSMSEADVRDKIPPATTPVEGTRALREAEPLPVYGVEDIDVNYTLMLQKFKERALFVDGVRKEALARTHAHHWLARKGKTGTTYSLMGPGAERIRTVAPVGFTEPRRRIENWTKEKGPGYTVYFEAEVYLGSPRSGLLPVMGTCSSDDDFFSTEHSELPYNPENPEHKTALESGEGRLSGTGDKQTIYIRRQIPASEVTRENIEKSALTNLIVNGVTRVLGIRSISAKELEDCGIKVAEIGGFEYGSTRGQSGALAPADEQKRADIKKWLIEMNSGDEAKALAEIKSRTAFNDYKGVDGWERLTVKQLANQHPRIKADYDAFREGQPQHPEKATKAAGAAKGQQGSGVKPPGPDQSPGGQKTLI
jgi:hypothetical protein